MIIIVSDDKANGPIIDVNSGLDTAVVVTIMIIIITIKIVK